MLSDAYALCRLLQLLTYEHTLRMIQRVYLLVCMRVILIVNVLVYFDLVTGQMLLFTLAICTLLR